MASKAGAPRTPWGGYRGLVGTKRALAALLVAAGIPLGLFVRVEGVRGQGEDDALDTEAEPAPRETPNVLVAMHLDEPIVDGKTIVWTAAFQAAWDALGDTVKAEWRLPSFDLGPPAKPEDVKALNDGRLTAGTVNPKDLTVIAGPATEETWAQIERASDRYSRELTLPLRPRKEDLVAFARLRARARYVVPFDVRTYPLPFGQEKTPVRAWGFPLHTAGDLAERMREQAVVHIEGGPGRDETRRAVVVLRAADASRVVVSGRPSKATLGETWRDVSEAMARTPADRFMSADLLWIPRVSLVTGRSFETLVGAPTVGVAGSRITLAREDVALTVDERGADLDAESVIHNYRSASKWIEFEGPFLLALLAPGSATPYALAWMGSADGLTRWDEAIRQRVTALEAKPFVGEWTLDQDESVRGTVARQLPALRKESPKTPEKDLASWARTALLEEQAEFGGFDLEIGSDGVARATIGDPPSTPALLVRDGARVALVVTTPTFSRRWFLSRDGDRLTLRALTGGLTLVLRRR